MMAIWMLYSIVLGGCLAIAATALDHAARTTRYPTRFVWLGALIGAVALPVVLPLVPVVLPGRTSPAESTMGPVRPLGTAGPGNEVVAASWLPRAREFAARNDATLAIAWMMLTAVLLGRVGVATIRLLRQREAWVAREIDGVPLFVTPDLGPAVVAIPDSRIVVPQWLLGLDAASLSTVIRHERQHSMAGDAPLLLAGSLAAALVPWNPAVWYARRRLRLAVEVDCDARVLAEDPRVDHYGSLLLAIAEHPRLTPRLSAMLTESTSDLERRIDAMTARPPGQPRIRAALFVAAAAGAITIACSMPAPDVVAPRVNEPVTSIGAPLPVAASSPFLEFQVEKPASADPSNQPPRYPAQLRAANVSGAVKVRFVVDTAGAVDMRAFEVISSDHEAFTVAVRDALAKMKFSPAEAGGRKVKQMVAMPFAFSLVGSSPIQNPRPVEPVTRAAVPSGRSEQPTAADGAFLEFQVERPAAADPSNQPPVYPPLLRAAKVGGAVRVKFVVDTTGSIDMRTVKVVRSDHEAFTVAVREALPKLKFFPAQVGGRKVKQLITMPFLFSLAR